MTNIIAIGLRRAPVPALTNCIIECCYWAEAAGGCAGCVVAPTALQTYVQVFEEDGARANFEAVASLNGPAFYGLPVNKGSITLTRRPSRAPECVAVEDENVVVFGGGVDTAWSVT